MELRPRAFLLATLCLLICLSLPAGYHKLQETPDALLVDGMRFAKAERALAERVLQARNTDAECRQAHGVKPPSKPLIKLLHDLLETDRGEGKDIKSRRAVYALRLGEAYSRSWLRKERLYMDWEKARYWWRDAQAWAQPDQEFVYWRACAGLVTGNFIQGRRIAGFFEAVRAFENTSTRPTEGGYHQISADHAKGVPIHALLDCGKYLSPGTVLVALHRAAGHADPVVVDLAAGIRAKAPPEDHHVNPLDLPVGSFVPDPP